MGACWGKGGLSLTVGGAYADLWLLVALLMPAVRAQDVKRIPLKPATAMLEAEFIGITSVREVADGRVIITDGRDQTLYLADFKANKASILGRKGKGPEEWLAVGFIHATSGDSSIMSDYNNQRFMLFDGAKIVGTVPPDHPGVLATRSFISDIDRQGRNYADRQSASTARDYGVHPRRFQYTRVRRSQHGPHRHRRATSRSAPSHRSPEGFPRRGGFQSFATEPNAQAEVAKLFNDGWLAVVRSSPCASTGVHRTVAGHSASRSRYVPNRSMRRSARRSRRAGPKPAPTAKKYGLPEPTNVAYPTTLPVMATAGLRARPSDGRLLLRRTSSASNPAVRYLVINRSGVIDGEIVLGAKEDVIGFGPHTVYVAFKDDDDIQRLRRHPWP